MKLFVNGQERDVPDGLTVAGLLEHLNLHLVRVAVERNREIVPRSRHNQEVLAEGDRIEIVQMVGGG